MKDIRRNAVSIAHFFNHQDVFHTLPSAEIYDYVEDNQVHIIRVYYIRCFKCEQVIPVISIHNGIVKYCSSCKYHVNTEKYGYNAFEYTYEEIANSIAYTVNTDGTVNFTSS